MNPPPPGNEHPRSVRTHLYSSVTEYLLQRIIGEVALSSCNNHWHLNMGEPFFQTAGRRKLILLVITIGVFLRVPPFQLFSFQRAVMNWMEATEIIDFKGMIAIQQSQAPWIFSCHFQKTCQSYMFHVHKELLYIRRNSGLEILGISNHPPIPSSQK